MSKIEPGFIFEAHAIKHTYKDLLPQNLEKYYQYILNGDNLPMYIQMFNLSEEDLIKYAKICKIIAIVEEVEALLGLIEEEVVEITESEMQEYTKLIEQLEAEGAGLLEAVSMDSNQDNETISNENPVNLLIYPNFFDKNKPLPKTVTNIFEKLINSDYQKLREARAIHQHQQQQGAKIPYYINGYAYARIGTKTAKISLIRIPVSANNQVQIKNIYNIDFEALLLIVDCGDFALDGYAEEKYYRRAYLTAKNNTEEIVRIINIFKHDFTDETLPIATRLIDEGLEVTKRLTVIEGQQAKM